jgi:chromosome segregation ATPase
MKRKDKKLQKENIATRDKGMFIVRELDRLVRAINKALKNRDDRAKAIEAELQDLGKVLKKNLDNQYKIDRDFENYDNTIGKIFSNLQLLENEEETYAGQYDRLLNGNRIESDSQKSDDFLPDDSIPAERENHELDNLGELKKRREVFFQNLNQEFKNLEDKLSSIGKLRSELENSHYEIGEKKAHTLNKKKALEEEGNKLLNEVENLENELEITILEEKNLLEESFNMINRVESCLGLDEKTGQVLFSSQAAIETDETSSASRPTENGHKIAIGT